VTLPPVLTIFSSADGALLFVDFLTCGSCIRLPGCHWRLCIPAATAGLTLSILLHCVVALWYALPRHPCVVDIRQLARNVGVWRMGETLKAVRNAYDSAACGVLPLLQRISIIMLTLLPVWFDQKAGIILPLGRWGLPPPAPHRGGRTVLRRRVAAAVPMDAASVYAPAIGIFLSFNGILSSQLAVVPVPWRAPLLPPFPCLWNVRGEWKEGRSDIYHSRGVY